MVICAWRSMVRAVLCGALLYSRGGSFRGDYSWSFAMYIIGIGGQLAGVLCLSVEATPDHSGVDGGGRRRTCCSKHSISSSGFFRSRCSVDMYAVVVDR